jgi:hypothetical protein
MMVSQRKTLLREFCRVIAGAAEELWDTIIMVTVEEAGAEKILRLPLLYDC